MGSVIWTLEGVVPRDGDYCPIERFGGLRSNGITEILPQFWKMNMTPDEEGWVGYTGRKRAILGDYIV